IRQFMFDHIMDIDRILAKLDFANFTLNGYKAFFCVPEVTILSYVCNQDGRTMDTLKIEKVVNWPTP
ncbi:hypothetical protein ROZALSC1DRAFT_9773, partial [Rozella allomycis CSF55]